MTRAETVVKPRQELLEIAPLELSDSLWEAYGQSGDIADLDQIINVLTRLTVERTASFPEQTRPSDAMSNLGVALLSRYRLRALPSDLDQAIEVLEQALENETRSLARSRVSSNLALAILARGEVSGSLADVDVAISLLRRSIVDRVQSDLESVEVRSNLGAALLRHWSLTGDVASLDESLRMLRRAASSSSEGTSRASIRSNLADALWSARNYHGLRSEVHGDFDNLSAEAVAIYEEVLSERSLLLGAEHPDTLASRNNLASALFEQGSLTRARELYEEVVAVSRRVLGEGHLSVLIALCNLASVLFVQGDGYRSRLLLSEAVDGLQQRLGEDHPLTLAQMEKLALAGRGEAPKTARNLLEHVAVTRQRVLGGDHPDTLSSLQKLAEVLLSDTDVRLARALFERVLEGRIRVLGETDVQTLETMDSYSEALDRNGESAAAADVSTRASNIRSISPTWLEASRDSEDRRSEATRRSTLIWNASSDRVGRARKTLRLRLLGKSASAQARSLWTWLVNRPNLRDHIASIGSSVGELPAFDKINWFEVDVEESETVNALAEGVSTWVRTRKQAPRLAVDLYGGLRIELPTERFDEDSYHDLEDALRRVFNGDLTWS